MKVRIKAVPKDCQGTKEQEVKLKHFTIYDSKDLRHQMYMYLIINNFAKDKEDAIKLLKKYNFLLKGKKDNKYNKKYNKKDNKKDNK